MLDLKMQTFEAERIKETVFGTNFVRANLFFMHQSIPAAPPPPPPPPPPLQADPLALTAFLPWMANSRGWGFLSCQIPRGGGEKRR